MKKSKLISVILVLMFTSVLTACATVTFTPDGNTRTGAGEEKKWTHHYLGHAFGPSHIKANCPAGTEVVQTETRITAGTFFVGFFTLSIYTPRIAEYWCE